MKTRMRDVVVVLPGITGSVLQHDGRDVWAVSRGGVWGAITSLGRSFDRLALRDDDPDVDDLGDGVTAPRLMDDVHMIPGLVKIDGYSRLVRMLSDGFEVVVGDADDDRPANLLPFPYDWRRDNRVAARRLARMIERALPRWREHTGAEDAKVILIAHSMGGLVSRHYLEVLGGWEHCRALITFGTPYRGSPNALGYLANGFRKLALDLTEVLRSCTSVYQLLPIYRSIRTEDGWARAAELTLPNVDPDRARAALTFHRDIETAVSRRGTDDGYTLLPFVGTRQRTSLSARLENGHLSLVSDAPQGVDAELADGDGTVPRLSAIPIELSNAYRDTFVAERHSSLQCHAGTLTDLRERLRQMQTRGLESIRGPAIAPERQRAAAIALEVDDLYLRDEPVSIGGRIVGEGTDVPLVATVGLADGTAAVDTAGLVAGEVEFTGIAPGTYRVEVRPARFTPGGPDPVHDLFEVAP
jgi:pimeloyl-ACP methyl ester carboxylesterase